jgi:hypothetical protein
VLPPSSTPALFSSLSLAVLEGWQAAQSSIEILHARSVKTREVSCHPELLYSTASMPERGGPDLAAPPSTHSTMWEGEARLRLYHRTVPGIPWGRLRACVVKGTDFWVHGYIYRALTQRLPSVPPVVPHVSAVDSDHEAVLPHVQNMHVRRGTTKHQPRQAHSERLCHTCTHAPTLRGHACRGHGRTACTQEAYRWPQADRAHARGL